MSEPVTEYALKRTRDGVVTWWNGGDGWVADRWRRCTKLAACDVLFNATAAFGHCLGKDRIRVVKIKPPRPQPLKRETLEGTSDDLGKNKGGWRVKLDGGGGQLVGAWADTILAANDGKRVRFIGEVLL